MATRPGHTMHTHIHRRTPRGMATLPNGLCILESAEHVFACHHRDALVAGPRVHHGCGGRDSTFLCMAVRVRRRRLSSILHRKYQFLSASDSQSRRLQILCWLGCQHCAQRPPRSVKCVRWNMPLSATVRPNNGLNMPGWIGDG